MGRIPKQISTPKQKRRRCGFWILLAILLVPALLMYADVQRSRSFICESVTSAPSRPVAIVFGAAGGILEDRVSTGVELYKAGKVKKLLMTGDNGRDDYNEPQTMKEQAIAAGIPAKDIALDYAGFRTYDSRLYMV